MEQEALKPHPESVYDFLSRMRMEAGDGGNPESVPKLLPEQLHAVETCTSHI